MKNLLMKEFRLAMHPTIPLFWGLSAMLLIPNYPYYVAFFYTALGIFFSCLGGRENHDIEYSLLLPIRKRDLVRGRFAFALLVEAVQVLLAALCTLLRQAVLRMPPNAAGMDANLSLFGLSLLMLGLFNYLFFTGYYGHPAKVGRVFAYSSVAVFAYILVVEACAHALPYVKNHLDTPDPQFLGEKLLLLALGLGLYLLLTGLAYRKSVRRFEALDL